MSLPKVPKEVDENDWKKAASNDAKALDEAFGESRAGLRKALAAVSEKQLKSMETLESAIKGRDGGAVVGLYQNVGNEVCPQIDSMQRLAGEYQKSCKTLVARLRKDDKAKAAVVWLEKSGPALVAYADKLHTFADALLADAEKVPTEKITDFRWDLNEWDLTHLLVHVLGLRLKGYSLPEEMPVAVSITGKAGASAIGNATLRAEFFESAYQIGKAQAPHLLAKLEDIDKRFMDGDIGAREVPHLVNAELEKFESTYRDKADAAAQKLWTELNKDRADYQEYEIQFVANIGKSIAGIVVGAVEVAAAGWTGIGTVMGLAQALRDTVKLGTDLANGILTARGLAASIRQDLMELQQAYKNGAPAGTREVEKAVIERLTGLQLATIPTVKKNIELYENKLKGCNVNGTEMGVRIDSAFREADLLQKKLHQAKSQLRDLKQVDIDALGRKHQHIMTAVGRLVVAAARYKEDYQDGLNALVVWGRQLRDLDGDVPEVAKNIQKWVVPLVDFAFVTDLNEVLKTAQSLTDEYVDLAAEEAKHMLAAHRSGALAGDAEGLATRLIG